jgi:hypothetical protein
MRERRLLQGLLIGSSVLLLFAILLTVANISRYKGQMPGATGAVSRPAPGAPVQPAEPAGEEEAPAEEPAAE